MSWTKMIAGAVMVSLFVLSLILFATNFAEDNESSISIAQDGRYGALNSSIQSGLDDFADKSSDSQTYFLSTTLEPGDEHAGSGAQFKVTPFNAMSIAMNATKTGFDTIFGPEFRFIRIAIVSTLGVLLAAFGIQAWLGRSP